MSDDSREMNVFTRSEGSRYWSLRYVLTVPPGEDAGALIASKLTPLRDGELVLAQRKKGGSILAFRAQASLVPEYDGDKYAR